MKTQPLRLLFMVWTVLLVVVPGLLIMAVYTYGQILEAKQEKLELISQRVSFQKRLIEYWMAERAGTVRELSQSWAVQVLDEQQMEQALHLKKQSDSNFEALSYIDKDGLFRLSTLNQAVRHFVEADKPCFEAAKAGKEYVSDVTVGRISGQPIMVFSAPVYDSAGNFQGLIVGSIRTAALETFLREHWIGKTGEILLVNSAGMMLTEPRFLHVLIARGDVDNSAIMHYRITDDALRIIRQGQAGTAAWTDFLGNKVLGAYSRLSGHGWTLIGKIDEAEVLAPLYAQLEVMAGSTIVLVMLTFLLATFIAKRVKEPIAWLNRQADLIAAEDYAAVGRSELPDKMPRELDHLCRTFIKMSGRMQGAIGLLKEHEAMLKTKVLEIQKVNAALERGIKDREEMSEVLRYKLHREEVLARISQKLISCPMEAVNEEIGKVLELVGELTEVEFAGILLDNTGGTACAWSHTWSRRGRFCAGAANYDIAAFTWERDRLMRFEHLAVACVSDLPGEAAATKTLMEAAGWTSLIALPMAYMGNIRGFLMLANVSQVKGWLPEQVAWLRIVAELITNSVERKKIHDSLLLRDKEYRALMDAVPDLFFEIDGEGIIRSARGLLSRQMLPPAEVIGKNVFEVYPPEVARSLFDNVQLAIATKVMRTVGYDIIINEKLCKREARIVSNKDNEALVVIRDMTEEKLAEQKMIEAARMAEEGQRLASLGVMAAGIAHEINQPLNSIKVSASGMICANKNKVKLAKETMLKEFAWISEQADRIDDIIGNIRMFVKNDYSTRRAVDLERVIDQAVKAIYNHPRLQEVSIKTCVYDNLPTVLVNAVHLQQVIVNLLVNAAHSLSQSPRRPKVIRITAWAEEAVIMEISDNGLGIQEDMAERIFEPFISFNSDDQAMGLGLSIVQTIVAAYGGEVRGYNNNMGGATFRIELPRITS